MTNYGMTLRLAGACIAIALTTGCATTGADPRDPIEPVNRAVFKFNDTVDRTVLKPVAQGYRAAVPELVRHGVSNFFSNLWDPWIALNQVLQGKVEEGATDLMRFVTNTTFGLGGIFDVASEGGMEKHNEDFGQTLGVWGLETGPYLVLPILGPSNVRDGTGRVADSFGHLAQRGPEWLDFEHDVAWRNSLLAAELIDTRAQLLDASNVLEEAALDRYSFVRNAYLQRRRSLVHDGNPPPERYDDDYEDAGTPSAATDGKAPAVPAAPSPSNAPAPGR